MGEKKSNDISSESTHQIQSQKACILLARFSTKVVEIIVKFKILVFAKLFPFSLTWDHMGGKVSNDISFERTYQICSPKFMDIPRESLYQSC